MAFIDEAGLISGSEHTAVTLSSNMLVWLRTDHTEPINSELRQNVEQFFLERYIGRHWYNYPTLDLQQRAIDTVSRFAQNYDGQMYGLANPEQYYELLFRLYEIIPAPRQQTEPPQAATTT